METPCNHLANTLSHHMPSPHPPPDDNDNDNEEEEEELGGTLPNCYYNAMSMDEVRKRCATSFRSLPPAHSVCLPPCPSTPCYRYIRQETPLWSRLHAGRLTSGYIAAALGLYEPLAVKKLKLPKSRTSHQRVVEVWRHLCQEPYVPPPTPGATERGAEEHNAMITDGYNTGTDDRGVDMCGKEQEEEKNELEPFPMTTNQNQKRKKGKGKKNKNAAKKNTNTSTSIPEHPTNPWEATRISSYTSESGGIIEVEDVEAFKLRKARYVASEGLHAIRCAWGKVQEATTLFLISKLVFPQHTIEEVGMCPLVSTACDAVVNVDIDTVPLIAASPDALLVDPTQEGDRRAIIEIKNVCPFQSATTPVESGKKSKNFKKKKNGCSNYTVHDRGPKQRIDPLWVPQVQLMMMCTGINVAYIVCRSATRGLTVFRMGADEEMQRLMLQVVGAFYRGHVMNPSRPHIHTKEKKEKGGRVGGRLPPPRDCWSTLPEHQEMIRRIVKMVNSGVEVVKKVPGRECREALKHTDQRFFLSSPSSSSVSIL